MLADAGLLRATVLQRIKAPKTTAIRRHNEIPSYLNYDAGLLRVEWLLDVCSGPGQDARSVGRRRIQSIRCEWYRHRSGRCVTRCRTLGKPLAPRRSEFRLCFARRAVQYHEYAHRSRGRPAAGAVAVYSHSTVSRIGWWLAALLQQRCEPSEYGSNSFRRGRFTSRGCSNDLPRRIASSRLGVRGRRLQ